MIVKCLNGKNVPRVLRKRADASKANMGLTAWKGGVVRKGDVGTAKNYLTEQAISDFNLIINRYLDFAESQARRHQPMYMKDWVQRLDDFLQVNRLDILETAGKITAQQAENLPDPGTLAREIVVDLEVALDQFREIAEDLREGNVDI